MNHSGALFVFGTLMDADVLQLVSGQPLHTLTLEPAIIEHHVRVWVVGDLYPVLQARPGQSCEGLVISGLESQAMSRIAFYEGEEFTLEQISVLDRKNRPEQVWYFAYNHRQLVSEDAWSLHDWQCSSKSEAMPRIERFMQLYGVLSTAEADGLW